MVYFKEKLYFALAVFKTSNTVLPSLRSVEYIFTLEPLSTTKLTFIFEVIIRLELFEEELADCEEFVFELLDTWLVEGVVLLGFLLFCFFLAFGLLLFLALLLFLSSDFFRACFWESRFELGWLFLGPTALLINTDSPIIKGKINSQARLLVGLIFFGNKKTPSHARENGKSFSDVVGFLALTVAAQRRICTGLPKQQPIFN